MAIKGKKGRKILVIVDILGSTGPIRFTVDEEERVATVIHTVLRQYARQRRLPDLGSDIKTFLLYCYSVHTGYKALSPWESIGSSGCRKFGLYQKTEVTETVQTPENSTVLRRKGISRTWNTWIDKFFGFIIPSH